MRKHLKQIVLVPALMATLAITCLAACGQPAVDHSTAGTEAGTIEATEPATESETPAVSSDEAPLKGEQQIAWELTPLEDGTYRLSITPGSGIDPLILPGLSVEGKGTYPAWYPYMTEISELFVSKEIKQLGNQAFYGCTGLKKVIIEEGSALTLVGNGTFRNCSALKEIRFGDNLKSVGKNTFTGCTALELIDFGKGAMSGMSIGATTTKYCSSLHTVILPKALDGVANNAFYMTHDLQNIYWYGSDLSRYNRIMGTTGVDGEYLTEQDMNLYLWDETLNNGEGGWSEEPVHPGVTELANGVCAYRNYDVEGSLLFYGKGVVEDYKVEKDVTILAVMESITGFGADVFAEVKKLESVVYYGTEDQWAAVTGKEALADVPVEFRKTGKAGDAVDYELVSEDGGLTYKLIFSGTGDMADQVTDQQPWWHMRNFITSAEVKEGVTNIGAYTFSRLRQISDLKIASTVSMISTYSFWGATGFTELNIPEGVEVIGSAAFSCVGTIEKLNLPSTLRSINIKAFEYCVGIKEIHYNGYEFQWENVLVDNTGEQNQQILLAEKIFVPTPQVTDFADVAVLTEEEKEGLQFMYTRQLAEALSDAEFGANLNLTDEEVWTALYLWAGADSQYQDAMDWAKKNGLMAEDQTYGQMTEKKLNQILADVTAFNGYAYSGAVEGADTAVTRAEGLSALAAFFQGEYGKADRYDQIVATLKTALAAGGDGKMYVAAPNIFVENLGAKVGDCTFILFPDGQTMLIDAGKGVGAVDEETGEAADTGAALVPFLHEIGLTSLDYMVLSHAHNDHYGGLQAVAEYIYGESTQFAVNPTPGTIGQFWMPGNEEYGGLYVDYANLAVGKYLKPKNIPVSYFSVDEAGDYFDIKISDEVTVSIFGPTYAAMDPILEGGTGDEVINNGSLGMKFTFGDITYLTAGDTYISQEELLAAGFAADSNLDFLKADIIKSNHHGNYQSSGQAWVDAVQPKVMIAQIDGGGSDLVLNRVKAAGGVYYTTGNDGAVLVTMQQDGSYEVMTQYDSAQRKQATAKVDLTAVR